MAQVSMTVNMGARMKELIDQFCALNGTTQEETLADMLHMWERLVYVPWTEFTNKEKNRRRMLDLPARQRERAASGEVVALSEDGAYVVTADIKHFPHKPIIVTPAEMIEILGI